MPLKVGLLLNRPRFFPLFPLSPSAKSLRNKDDNNEKSFWCAALMFAWWMSKVEQWGWKPNKRVCLCFQDPHRCEIFNFCRLSFPQNERKMYKLRKLSLSQFVYFLREECLLFNFWMIKFTIMSKKSIWHFHHSKSKHTSLKKYTNWNKLSCLSLYIFLSFWGNERRQKPNIPHLKQQSTMPMWNNAKMHP